VPEVRLTFAIYFQPPPGVAEVDITVVPPIDPSPRESWYRWSPTTQARL
jgi:hypothetical protein